MKKLLLYLALAVGLFGADAANDLLLSQRKADNSGNIQRNVAPTTSGFLTFNASKVPTSPADLTYATPTFGVPDAFNISGAGSLRLSPNGTSGIGLAAPAGTVARLRLFGPSVSTTPVDSTWYTSANAGLFLGYSEGTGSGAGDFLVAHASDSTNGTNYIGRKARGTLATPTLVSNADVSLGFIGSFFDGTSFRNTAGFNMSVDGAASSGTAAPAQIQFSTGETTGRTAMVNMRANGRLEIGVNGRTTAAWATNGAIFRSIGGAWVDSTSATGTVGTATVFNAFAAPTLNTTNPSVVYTNLANVYIAGDVATTGNASATNSYGLWNVGKTRLDGAVVLPSTNTAGLQLYNTVDQVTNYERLVAKWASNAFRLETDSGGTGTARSIVIGAGGTSGGAAVRTIGINTGASGSPGTPCFTFNVGTTGLAVASGLVNLNATLTATSGTSTGLAITPTYNQASGTAANTDLLINRTETAVGSGTQLLIDAQVGGTSRFSVSNAGVVSTASLTLSGELTLTPQALSGAGAVSTTTSSTFYTSTGGAQALTLANGRAGQIKTIVHVVDGGSGVLTPTTALGYTTITFTNAGDSVTLQYTAQGWAVIGVRGATVA